MTAPKKQQSRFWALGLDSGVTLALAISAAGAVSWVVDVRADARQALELARHADAVSTATAMSQEAMKARLDSMAKTLDRIEARLESNAPGGRR